VIARLCQLRIAVAWNSSRSQVRSAALRLKSGAPHWILIWPQFWLASPTT